MIVENPDLQPTFTIQSASNIATEYPNLKSYVIDGLLRRGEIGNVIAASKVGKSFLSLGMVFSIAMGRAWLGHQTTQGRCLIVDNELHKETIASRLRSVADALGVSLDSVGVDVLSLRGRLCDLHELAPLFKQVAGKYSLIVLDAFYRILPADTNENDNAAITRLYNILDAYAADANAAIVLVHHASKGNQAGKEITDVGAGAGSGARATDSHIVIRPHAEEGHYVLEAGIRSSKPVVAKTVTYDWPLWSDVDVAPVVRDAAAKTQRDRAARKRSDKECEDRQEINKLLALCGVKPILKTRLFQKSGLHKDKFNRLLGLAEQSGAVEIRTARRKLRNGKPAAKKNIFIHRRFLTLDQASGGVEPVPWSGQFTGMEKK